MANGFLAVYARNAALQFDWRETLAPLDLEVAESDVPARVALVIGDPTLLPVPVTDYLEFPVAKIRPVVTGNVVHNKVLLDIALDAAGVDSAPAVSLALTGWRIWSYSRLPGSSRSRASTPRSGST